MPTDDPSTKREILRLPWADPWWYRWLPRMVAALGWAGVLALVFYVLAPLLWVLL